MMIIVVISIERHCKFYFFLSRDRTQNKISGLVKILSGFPFAVAAVFKDELTMKQSMKVVRVVVCEIPAIFPQTWQFAVEGMVVW